MSWGYSPPKNIINYNEEFLTQAKKTHDLLLSAGTAIQVGRYNSKYYLKKKRNDGYILNTAFAYNNKLTIRKIATATKDEIEIHNPELGHKYHLFQLSELAPRTLGYEHIIIRQDGLNNWPETKVRLDKPIFINRHTNELYQKHKLKKRVYDRKLKKQYKNFFESFAFEFKVLARMKHFTHYIDLDDSAAGKKIKVKSVTYTTDRWTLHNIEDAKGLLNPKWMHMNLSKQDRMQIATLTIFELANNWYSNNTQQYIDHVGRAAEDLATNIWGMFCVKAKKEETLQRHLKIATYEEQE